ncbi:MAG: exodeoxyribonuclease III, partial [Oscillospiraceae bacterium]|nr:exodeoxyribonuclease III [Oscillospiraceae bacterium]
ADFDLPGYERYWNSADKPGYSGVAVFTKVTPQSVSYDFGDDIHRHEGRVITADYGDFYLVSCYTPNSQDGLKRLDYRMVWEDDFRAYLKELDEVKPVILCGDLNVAHEEIDIKNPQSNRHNSGFTDEERGKMTELLGSGFVDSFRFLHPDTRDAYSWWSYRFHAREKNVGWRIDYFILSERIKDRIVSAEILSDVFGSDHCPVLLEISNT